MNSKSMPKKKSKFGKILHKPNLEIDLNDI